MTSVFHPAIRLPTVERFFDNTLSHLSDGLSVLTLLPKTAPIGDFTTELRSQFILRNINFLEIDLSHAADDLPPVTRLCREIGIRWKQPLSPRLFDQLPDACTFPDLMPDVVWLTGLEQVEEHKTQLWIDAALEWSENWKLLRDKGICLPAVSLVLPSTKCTQIPKSDVFFKIFYWFGIPSLLEMRLLCADANRFESGIARWKELIVPQLCIGDFSLLSTLFEADSLNERELGSTLMSIAEERGWTRELLLTKGIGNLSLANCHWLSDGDTGPSGDLVALWGEGIVDWSPGIGLAISSVALHVMGRHADIRHRIWCGQSELVLPLLNVVRLSVCDHMTKRYGLTWPVEYLEPGDPQEAAAVRDSPYNCQLGYLETVVNSWPDRQRLLRKIASHLREVRWMRNELAHNRVITFADFQKLCHTVEETLNLVENEF